MSSVSCSSYQLHREQSKKKGVIVGPVVNIDHQVFHCFPFMTRPKDGNKHLVIIDLSYPKGNSVNDFVDRLRFDGAEFTLCFPTIADIADDIMACTDDPVLFNIDVVQAFRNSHVDPADTLKFGIQWQGQLYVDVAILFTWVHSMTAFQLCLDIISFILAKQDVKLHCYVDDFIAFVPRPKAASAFSRTCALLQDLGLPLNLDKLTLQTKRSVILGIEVDANTFSTAQIN